jgi:hypoxanthine phosphoribosyltransferase
MLLAGEWEFDSQMMVEGLRRIVFDEETIGARVAELGAEISRHFRNSDDLLVLGVLKGSFIFLADLVRSIDRPLQVDFLTASSYGVGQVSSGEVVTSLDPRTRIQGRDVLLVEDIVDGGRTLGRLLPLLEAMGPRSLEVCTLLHKRSVELGREPRWVGFDAPREFLVGYGLDHAEEYRHLPFIGSV